MLASPLSHPRVGFIVPKYGRSGVERNRLKRQLREIVRTQLLMHLFGVDVVIKARANAYGVQFSALADELRQTPAEVARLLP
jgi:ribonuclease P protein component